MDLFNETDNGAAFSMCQKYRYALWRIWQKKKPMVMFIGLNPSTANASFDDPTIRRVKRFAFDWGFGGVYMMNLFPLVSTCPGELWPFYDKCSHDVEDEMNWEWLDEISDKCDKIIFAWGSFPEATERAKEVMSRYNGYALVINKDGSPRHPLYVKSDVEPVVVQASLFE